MAIYCFHFEFKCFYFNWLTDLWNPIYIYMWRSLTQDSASKNGQIHKGGVGGGGGGVKKRTS